MVTSTGRVVMNMRRLLWLESVVNCSMTTRQRRRLRSVANTSNIASACFGSGSVIGSAGRCGVIGRMGKRYRSSTSFPAP